MALMAHFHAIVALLTIVPSMALPIEESDKDMLYCNFPVSPENLGCGFKYFLFSPLFGEDSHFD